MDIWLPHRPLTLCSPLLCPRFQASSFCKGLWLVEWDGEGLQCFFVSTVESHGSKKERCAFWSLIFAQIWVVLSYHILRSSSLLRRFCDFMLLQDQIMQRDSSFCATLDGVVAAVPHQCEYRLLPCHLTSQSAGFFPVGTFVILPSLILPPFLIITMKKREFIQNSTNSKINFLMSKKEGSIFSVSTCGQ